MAPHSAKSARKTVHFTISSMLDPLASSSALMRSIAVLVSGVMPFSPLVPSTPDRYSVLPTLTALERRRPLPMYCTSPCCRSNAAPVTSTAQAPSANGMRPRSSRMIALLFSDIRRKLQERMAAVLFRAQGLLRDGVRVLDAGMRCPNTGRGRVLGKEPFEDGPALYRDFDRRIFDPWNPRPNPELE